MVMVTEFPRTRWSRRRFSESNAARIFVKISLICVSNVIMGIMTGLHRAVRPTPRGAGRVMQSIPERDEGFDVIIRPALEGAGRKSPPSQVIIP